MATISTSGKVSATALVDLASTPAGAGVIPAVNLALPVKTTGAEIDTGTDDAKFATAKAIADSSLASETAWVDYSATSTIVGLASFTTKRIYKKKIGDAVFVSFAIYGTSDATGFTFTLQDVSSSVVGGTSCISTKDNGNFTTTGGLALLPVSSSTVTITKTMAGASADWTNSGAKGAEGQFFYKVA